LPIFYYYLIIVNYKKDCKLPLLMAGYSRMEYRRTHRSPQPRPKRMLKGVSLCALAGIIGLGAYAVFSNSAGSAERASNAYPAREYSAPLGAAAPEDGVISEAKVAPKPEPALEERVVPKRMTKIANGLYFRQGRDESYPVDFFELIIDKRSKAKLFVTEPVGRQVLSSIISSYGAKACVNGGPFSMLDGSLTVYTVFKGEAYSSPEMKPNASTVCFGGSGISFGPKVAGDAKYCLTGFNRLLSGGEPNKRYFPGNEGYKETYSIRHPRTMIVDDAVNGWAYLVVVDGRSYSSAGLSTGEMIDFVKAHYKSAADAVNLDGGGSSEMIYMSGSGQVMPNVPSAGSERAISHAICVKSGK
jgi:hypothetical protein